ncbi:flavodoxin [Ruminococcus sp.]|uniref:flavodoxin n=1 Tax=Ruminococcus sp. TaxID=41978 RepID=UPI0025EFA0FD|nr:flavodoxin [Ruminococcus sp.]MBQ8966739.1 NAD(P)H-dependent oxidoreductase [Ruminococcus sp.]
MSKKLVAYFSAGGSTEKTAKKLAETAGADLYEIRPASPYTAEDLNWQNKQSRSSVEMSDHSSRPALADTSADMSAYDTVYVGFPIWWYIAPTIINTFLESYDLSGKKMILFATSGGSGFGKTAENLRPSAKGAEMIEGKVNPSLKDLEILAAM